MSKYDAHLGESDPGTALRARMSAAVSDIRMPAGLLDRAMSRNRKRKARNRLAGAAAGALAVAAVAAVFATVPGRSSAHPAALKRHTTVAPRVQTAVYILDRAAAAQINSYRMISVDNEPGSGLTYTDVATQQQRYLAAVRDSAGQPYFQWQTTISHGVWKETDVEYQHHVWSVLTASSNDQGQIVSVTSWLPLQTNADPAVAYRQALKTGAITVLGHRRLHGRDTILILVKDIPAKPGLSSVPRQRGETGTRGGPKALPGGPLPKRICPSKGTYTFPCRFKQPPVDPREFESWIWLDASTYQVVQTLHYIQDYRNGSPLPPRGCATPWSQPQPASATAQPGPARCQMIWWPVYNYVSWLRPTRAHLALVTLTPPAGFTQVSYSQMVQYLGPMS